MSPSSWVRERLLPFVLFVTPVVLAVLLGIHTIASIYQDIGRHIAVGELIATTKRIPQTNLFSFTNPDHPFVNHHWLSSTLLYLGERSVGLRALIALKAVVMGSAFALAYAAAWTRRSAVPAAITALVALGVLIERTDVRPEMLSFLFTGWFLFVLYSRPRLQWTLPIVQLVWVNSHIYFFVGPLLWVCWLSGEVVSGGNTQARRPRGNGGVGEWGNGRSLSRFPIPPTALLITAAMALACLVNPRFFEGAVYPLQVLRGYGYSIAENQSPFFMRTQGYAQFTTIMLFAGMGLALVSFAVNWRRVRSNVFGLLTCAITTALALSMIRNYPLFALVMLPATARNFEQAGLTLRYGSIPVLATAAAAMFAVVNGTFYERWQPGRSFGLIVPSGFQRPVDYFKTAGIKGPIFNNFDVGSFLIWKLPDTKVFIDGRPEAYPPEFIHNVYIPMQADAAVWEHKSAKYGINAIFWNTADATPWSKAFLERMTNDPSWIVAFFGDGILILLKATEENIRILEAHPPQIIPG